MAKTKKTAKPPKSSKLMGFTGIFSAVLAAALGGFSSGVVHVGWSEGTPSFSINSEQLGKIADFVNQYLPAGDLPEPSDANVPGAPSTPRGEVVATAGAPTVPAAPINLPANQMPAAPPRGGETIKIASYNIQVFGTSKLQKPKAMQVLTAVVRQFDIVAIQEVRSTDDNVIPTFVNMINAAGARYDFVIGPRLGRTNSKEQYAIIFDTARIEVDRASVYTVPDPQDLLHREPMVARFRVRGVPPERAFTFSLVDIHTDPDETKSELNALADVYVGVQQNGSGEDDIILLGDLNVDEYHLGNLGRLPNITHAVTQVTTNTRRNKMYDNIIFNRLATTEYVGRFGVYDIMESFGLSESDALQVSDHFPVWAEFSVYESGSGLPIATRPANPR